MVDAAPLTADDRAWEALTTEVRDRLSNMDAVSIEWAPAHSAPFVSQSILVPIIEATLARHRPLIEAAIRSGSPTDAALREAVRDYVDNFPGLGGDYEPDDPVFVAWRERFDALSRAASGSPEPVLDGLREPLAHLTAVAAAMVRGERTCSKGHRKDVLEHVHFEDVHHFGRLIANEVADLRAALATHASPTALVPEGDQG